MLSKKAFATNLARSCIEKTLTSMIDVYFYSLSLKSAQKKDLRIALIYTVLQTLKKWQDPPPHNSPCFVVFLMLFWCCFVAVLLWSLLNFLFDCTECDRVCKGLLGLIAYMRSHKDWIVIYCICKWFKLKNCI